MRRSESNAIFLFLLLAMLAGWPNRGRSLFYAMLWQLHAAVSLSALAAALLLGSIAWFRREPWPLPAEWCALLARALAGAAPGLVALAGSAAKLPMPSWELSLLIAMACPLWLALLHALGASTAVVPRATAGAAIAAIAGACLMLPGPGMVLQTPKQAVCLLLSMGAELAIVGAWIFARARLRQAGTCSLASAACLLAALVEAILSLALERPHWKPVPLTVSLVVALLVNAWFFTAGWYLLWFWLFRRMSLAAFSMQSIAAWFLPSLAGFLLYSFMLWRADLSVALGIAALYVGLRARPEDDHLTTLGVNQAPPA